MTTVGLMGFGRIGRNIFRNLYRRDDIRIAAISDTADAASLEYLLRFDTLIGRFPDEVRITDGHLYVYGKQIPFRAKEERDTVPPWGELGVDTVLEATARSRTRDELARHLAAGARRVILCAPPSGPVDLTVVAGINDGDLTSEHRIVSNASSTVHCIAPIAKLLLEAFGIQKLLFTTIHSYTSQHRLADVPAADKRLGRAAAENVIPQESRSPALLEGLLPGLKGKVIGTAMSVPVPFGSVVDVTAWLERDVSVTAVNEVVRTAASGRFARILRYETEPIVSSDVAHSPYSCTFDSLATMVLGKRVAKTLGWYDAGWGYAHRAVDVLERFADLDRGSR